MDDLEMETVGIRKVEDEAAFGIGLGLGSCRPMDDDGPGDGILRGADDLAPDLRGLSREAQQSQCEDEDDDGGGPFRHKNLLS